MGFLRGTVITFFSIVLFVLLFLMSLTLTLSLSLNHDTLQPAFKSYVGNTLRNYAISQDIFSQENQVYMKNYCSIRNEYTFTYENYSVTIPCQVMENGTDAIIDYGAGHIFDQVYYSEYNCEFWQCVKDSQTLFVLVSEKAMNYWKGKFAILLGLSFIVFASIFLISRSRATTLIVTGVLIVIAVLPFRKLNWALNLVPQKLSGIFSVFFTKAHSVFVIMLVIGIVLIAFGIVSKMFGWKMEFGKDSSEEEEPEEKNRSNSRYKKKYSK